MIPVRRAIGNWQLATGNWKLEIGLESRSSIRVSCVLRTPERIHNHQPPTPSSLSAIAGCLGGRCVPSRTFDQHFSVRSRGGGCTRGRSTRLGGTTVLVGVPVLWEFFGGGVPGQYLAKEACRLIATVRMDMRPGTTSGRRGVHRRTAREDPAQNCSFIYLGSLQPAGTGERLACLSRCRRASSSCRRWSGAQGTEAFKGFKGLLRNQRRPLRTAVDVV